MCPGLALCRGHAPGPVCDLVMLLSLVLILVVGLLLVLLLVLLLLLVVISIVVEILVMILLLALVLLSVLLMLLVMVMLLVIVLLLLKVMLLVMVMISWADSGHGNDIMVTVLIVFFCVQLLYSAVIPNSLWQSYNVTGTEPPAGRGSTSKTIFFVQWREAGG